MRQQPTTNETLLECQEVKNLWCQSEEHNINIFKMIKDVNEGIVILKKDQRSNSLKINRNDILIYRN